MPFLQRLRSHIVPHHTNAYRPYLLRRGWTVFFLSLVLATEGFLVASLVARQSSGSFLAAVVGSELVSLTNQERVDNHVAQLTENKALDAAAQAKAEDMAAKSYFAHVGPDGKQPWDWISASGYDYEYAGENLAVRFVDSADVVNAWMASPTHRANIVKPVYRDIGIGVAEGVYEGAPATYVVQYFGTQEPGQVLGAEVGPPQNILNSITRAVGRAAASPRDASLWILGGVAVLLILLVGLAVIFHLQLQAIDLLVPSTVVAGIALVLFAFNATILSDTSGQSAAVLSALGPQTVVIDDAAAIQR